MVQQNSKIPKLTPDLINQNLNLYNKLIQINEQIEIYLSKNWDVDDIIIRLDSGDSKNSLFTKVMEMRQKYIDDYE